jgi:hypothetical protein
MFGQPDVADGTEKALAANVSTERVWELRAHARKCQASSEVTISCDLEPNTRSSKNRTEGAISREGSRPFALCAIDPDGKLNVPRGIPLSARAVANFNRANPKPFAK